MNTILYTFGYNGGDWDRLNAMLERPRTMLVDIRFNPWGRPGMRKADFEKRFGRRYTWCKHLGNETYKSSTIKIHDAKLGVQTAIRAINAGQTVILMCACADLQSCHRLLVSQMIADAFGKPLTIEHLIKPATPAAPKATELPGLFG